MLVYQRVNEGSISGWWLIDGGLTYLYWLVVTGTMEFSMTFHLLGMP